MIKNLLIKDGTLMIFIGGAVLLAGMITLDEHSYLDSNHLNMVLLGYYVSWLSNYSMNKHREKLLKNVAQDFCVSTVVMADMLEVIKQQKDIIDALTGEK